MNEQDNVGAKPVTFILLARAEKLLNETYITTRQYPKSERFVLGADTRQAATNFLRLIIRAQKKYFKKTTLQDADIELEELRHLIRFAYEQHYISAKRYEIMARITTEAGKLLGGWIRQQKSK